MFFKSLDLTFNLKSFKNRSKERKTSMNKVSMLTTIDNPFDPFTQFDEWLSFDEEKGYMTCEYLARIAKTSSDLSETDQNQEIERAIDEIIDLNVLGIYKKVTKEL